MHFFYCRLTFVTLLLVGVVVASDEPTCSASEFLCKSSSRCIPRAWLCDGSNDCPDASDEHHQHCHEHTNNSTCFGNQPECLYGGISRCIPHEWLCDGHLDCDEGDDEFNCDEVTPIAGPCGLAEFTCVSGGCVPRDLVCNDQLDCMDGSDEAVDRCSTPKRMIEPESSTALYNLTEDSDLLLEDNHQAVSNVLDVVKHVHIRPVEYTGHGDTVTTSISLSGVQPSVGNVDDSKTTKIESPFGIVSSYKESSDPSSSLSVSSDLGKSTTTSSTKAIPKTPEVVMTTSTRTTTTRPSTSSSTTTTTTTRTRTTTIKPTTRDLLKELFGWMVTTTPTSTTKTTTYPKLRARTFKADGPIITTTPSTNIASSLESEVQNFKAPQPSHDVALDEDSQPLTIDKTVKIPSKPSREAHEEPDESNPTTKKLREIVFPIKPIIVKD